MSNFVEYGDGKRLYQPYSYQFVRPGVCKRIRWYVAARSNGQTRDDQAYLAALDALPVQYQSPYRERIGQAFTGGEATALLAYLQTVPDFQHTGVVETSRARLQDRVRKLQRISRHMVACLS